MKLINQTNQYQFLNRSDIEDERKINHHGKSRPVKSDKDQESKAVAPPSAMIGFDKNLVSVQEQVQDKALREYYSKVKLTKEKEKLMRRYMNFSRRVKPVIALLFVTVYWVSGLVNYQRME